MHTNNNSSSINNSSSAASHIVQSLGSGTTSQTGNPNQNLPEVTPTTDRRHLRFALLSKMRTPARAIKHLLHKILATIPKHTQKAIEGKVAQRIEQLRQNHIPYSLTEKTKLYSELHQKYVTQHSAMSTKAEAVIDFIKKSLLENDSSDLTHDSIKKELECFLEQQIKDLPSTTYDELKQFLNQEKITSETKNFDKRVTGQISDLAEEISEEIIDNFKPEELKEFIEDMLSINIQKFIENFLLHKETPHLFKKIISEEIHENYMSNHDISNFLIYCSSSTKSFIENAIMFHTNKEKSLGHFMNGFLSEAKESIDKYKKAGLFETNRDEFNKEIELLLSQYPYIEENSPKLFNALKNTPEKIIENGISISKNDFGLDKSIVISAHTFEAYALTNTLNREDLTKLKGKYPEMGLPEVTQLYQKLKFIIGQGGFGKVRFARNINTGHYVAVKKITHIDAAKTEVDSYKNVGTGRNLVSLYNHATATNKNGQEKSYLFIEFVQGGDGRNFLREIENTITINANYHPQDAKELKRISKEYLYSVAELHQKGVFHCDIKPENFLHASNGDIKIIDYGLYSTDRYKRTGGTPKFNCPESFSHLGKTHLYDAQKHDSFSLGISLMEQKSAFERINLGTKMIDSLGNSYSVNIHPVQMKNRIGFHFAGFESTKSLAGQNIDEVIMKLMDKDPAQRITPEQALQLPYFLGRSPP